MSRLLLAAIALVVVLALSQTGALAADMTSSSSSVTVRVAVTNSMQLSLPASVVGSASQSLTVRSNAPLQFSADVGPSPITASTVQAEVPDVLYTVVSR